LASNISYDIAICYRKGAAGRWLRSALLATLSEEVVAAWCDLRQYEPKGRFVDFPIIQND